jgi:hypothetical protein
MQGLKLMMSRRVLIVALLFCGLTMAVILLTALVRRGQAAVQPAAQSAARLPAGELPVLPKQIDLPVYGWTVCGDLGFGPVPGRSLSAQRMEMCHSSGWVLQTYCLDPNLPAPSIGGICSMLNATHFWCSDTAQQLRQYQIAQTPSPSQTPVSTATRVPTATQPASTQTLPASSGEGEATAVVAQATVFVRPHAGGEGTLAPTLSILAAGGGLILLIAGLFLTRRR